METNEEGTAELAINSSIRLRRCIAHPLARGYQDTRRHCPHRELRRAIGLAKTELRDQHIRAVIPLRHDRRPMSELKLIALDAEDLSVISAHLQDAVLKIGDMAYSPRDRRFAAVLNRFDWAEPQPAVARRGRSLRARCALRFERVTAARLLQIDTRAKSQVMSLLAIQFEHSLAPAGVITMTFAGGAALRLDVECIETELRDMGAAWAARGRPDHGAS